MGILTLLRNAFGGRSRKGQTTEAGPSQEAAPSQTAAPAEATEPKVPAPSTEPTPAAEPTPAPATAAVPEPRTATLSTKDEHDLVSAAFDKVEVPKQAPPAEEPETAAEPTAESTPEPVVTEEPVAEAAPEPVVTEEPVAEVAPEPVAEVAPEPVAEVAPEPEPEPVVEPEPVAEITPEPVVEPEAEPVAETAEEAVAETAAEPVAVEEPTAEAEPEPTTVEEPAAEIAAEPEPEIAAEPVAEATPEPELAAEPVIEATPEPEPVAEVTPEPAPEPEPEAVPTPEPVAAAAETAVPATDDAPAAADDEDTPQGPLAADDESGTGGAGGNNNPAEGRDVPATLLTAYNAAETALKATNLTGTTAKVYLVLDRSASMRAYYKDGSAQALGEQTLALAAHLDPEAKVHVVFFSTELDGTGELTLTDHDNKIDDLHAGLGRMGRTSYHAAVEAVVTHHDKEAPGTPALVVFQTDGAPDAKTPATQSLTDAAKNHPSVFFSFVAFGAPENKAFDYLRKLKLANTSHFLAGETPRELTDTEIYEGILATWRP
ncbi:VWA domain-containing protein [Streptomyces fulvoviolaceus]|uniref:VWA domain-containing protein n=1 Tax=Streptomyces fulvoviolaceus TaxID=285535 RepID=UPI0021BE531F|nr:VWA domain-containing protein [Streptomyces fulvoviolaceus]MCT9075035.1 VWA domain-containing protein [Streptomyces fulvoviolaceus]